MFGQKRKVLEIDGVLTPIDPDFRIMCEYADAVGKSDREGLCRLAEKFYFAGLPEKVSERGAVMAMERFYIDGIAPDSGEKKGGSVMKKEAPVFDFSEDEGYFYAAFLSEYGIDLNSAKLHWFDFCALFRGLPDECRLKKIIGIRAESLSDIKSASEKARVRKLKGIFALKSVKKPRFESAEERDRAMLEEIQRIHELARAERGEDR